MHLTRDEQGVTTLNSFLIGAHRWFNIRILNPGSRKSSSQIHTFSRYDCGCLNNKQKRGEKERTQTSSNRASAPVTHFFEAWDVNDGIEPSKGESRKLKKLRKVP